MNLELLKTEFRANENPGLDIRDPRFVDITAMVQESNFSGAKDQAEKIIQEEIYDIRIISYFLYGIFDELGPSSFKDIFNCLETIFQKNWDALGPLKNKAKHGKNSLNWFFKQTNKILERAESKKGTKWQAWLLDTDPDDIEQALEIAKRLQETVSIVFEKQSSGIIDGITRTTSWLDTFYPLIYHEPEPESDPEPEESTDSGSEDSSKLPGTGTITESDQAPENQTVISDNKNLLSGSESFQLQMLLKKMTVFGQLLKEDKITGAALVADDIQQIITNFDPLVYFPDLFSKFTRDYAVNIEKLLAFEHCREMAEWQSMETFYKVDMDGFLNLETDFHFKSPDAFQGMGQKKDPSLETGYNEDDIDEEPYYEEEPDDY